MNQKLSELISVYEDYKDVVKTDYVSKLAFLVGLIAVLSTLGSELLFRVWQPHTAFWTMLVIIGGLIIWGIVKHINPLGKEHKQLRKIVNNLRHIDVYGKLNKAQEKILEKMWDEVYNINNRHRTLKDDERRRYYSKIENWTFCLYELKDSKKY